MMRVVEYSKDTTSVSYQAIRALGIVSAVLAAVVCALLIANNLSLKKADPVHSPALEALLEKLKADPKDQAIREEIRELDYLARRAFFTSQRFNRLGVYVLLGSLVVMVISFKTVAAYRAPLPYPDTGDPREDLRANAHWARRSVTAAGLVLVGAALMLALPWNSPLDHVGNGEGGVGTVATPDAGAPVVAGAPDTAVKPAAAGASREEMLKNWPWFRGAGGGMAVGTDAPVAWNVESGEGVVWKVEVPKPGFSSPILWGNHLYLSGGDGEGNEIYCYGSEKGELVWRHEVKGIAGSPAEAPKVSEDTGYAAATMATDGVRVFAVFASGDLVALTLDGDRLWARNLGMPKNPYGHASSLVVHEGLLLVQYDQKEGGFFAGLNVADGTDRWRVARNLGASWSSPALIETGNGFEAVLAAETRVISYDSASGKMLWEVECLKGSEVAVTPEFAEGMLFVAADYRALTAIEVTSRAIRWENEESIPGVSTPVAAGGLLFCGLADGGMVCYEAKTGKELWYKETDNGFYASPIVAGDRIYMLDRSGMMHIFAVAAEFKSLGTPELGEEAVSTPVVTGKSIYCRGMEHLFKLGT